MKVLSRYSQTKDISRSNVEYTSQREYIDALSKGQKAQTAQDYETPYSFKQWKDRNVGTIASEEYNQYQEYLRNWYQSRFDPQDIENLLKNDFIELIKSLKLVMRDDELNKWIEDINFDDPLEVSEAIPYFARKLKEIAIYLVNKRESIKKAKLKYNMAGATNSLEYLFYEYLLKAFTQRDYVLNIPEQGVWSTLPQLSGVKDGFQIFVEELYDDTSYFDKDPTLPVSGYYDLTDPDVVEYFNKLDFPVKSLEWLYQTGITPIFANNPLLWTLADVFAQYNASTINDIPLSAFDDISRNRLLDYYKMDLTQKYIGETQYILSGGYYIPKTQVFNWNLQEGNNWFYWPTGEYSFEQSVEFYDSIPIASSNLIENGAFASEDYKNADKIFVEKCGDIKGAWLKLSVKDTTNKTMSASIDNYPNILCEGYQFRFPFPGYGVESEDIIYTGPELNNTLSRFNLLQEIDQKNVLNKYWSNSFANSSIDNIMLHDTTLIDEGANAGLYYNEADKLTIRQATDLNKIHDSNRDSVYIDGFRRAWLYKFLKTDIPLKTGQNKIQWPLKTYENSDDIKFSVLSSQCAPIALSSIDARQELIGARAGYGLFDSDIIYKLDSPDGYPIECAYLSGVPINGLAGTTWTANTTGVIQPSFTLKCIPGQYQTFIWQDNNLLINQSTIMFKQHQIDCPYLKTQHPSIYENRYQDTQALEESGQDGVSNWKKCECKSIIYSPIGHPGKNYNDFNRMTDIVFVDTMFPSAMNFEDWRGTDGLPYNQSQDFAWFQLTGNHIEPDVGWGNGYWRTGAGTLDFTFKTGVLYKMLRTNLQRSPGDLFLEAIPPLYIKQKHVNTPQPIWNKTILQPDGTWAKPATAVPTDMIINPGDYIMYDHGDSNWYCLTSNDQRFIRVETPNFIFSIIDETQVQWSNFTYGTTGNVITYNWPDVVTNNGPIYPRNSLKTIYWEVTSPSSIIYKSGEYSIDEIYKINADQVGIYLAAATGYLQDDTPVIATNIPGVTALSSASISAIDGLIDIDTIYIDTLNMTWCNELKGWNYETHSYDASSIGGRPFWAEALDDDSVTTKYKGTKVWGGGIITDIIDEYTFMTQPPLADEFEIGLGDYIDYKYTGSNNLLWCQPIIFNANIEDKKWCELQISSNITSPLSTYMCNIDKELIISALDTPSDIILHQSCGVPLFVNYWANEAFTWTQELTDSTLGLPPTGGVWMEGATGILVDPVVPYANLTNRHFPTIASIPYVGNIYNEADVGGFFTPKGLGVSVYLGKQYTNTLDATHTQNVIYKNIDNYTSDYGLTNQYQVSPIKIEDINSSWMKAGLTQGARAGFVANTKTYQEFIPYQTRYESQNIRNVGIRHMSDDYDPWTGYNDTTWIDETNFPPNFRGEHPIRSWYNQFPLQGEYKMTVWKTDVFGNNYALFKDKNINSIYDEKIASGDLWIRNSLGKIGAGNDLLENVYNKMISPSGLYYDISSNQIWNFDIFYDVILFETPNYIGIQKLRFDYDTKEIFSITDDLRYIDLSGNWFAGYWLHEDNKILTLCDVLFDNGLVYPTLHKYNLDTGEFRKVYDGYNDSTLLELSATNITSIEKPVFTYNHLTKTYNVTFLGIPVVVCSINIKDNIYKSSVTTISPSS
jgi:hypothetical protein